MHNQIHIFSVSVSETCGEEVPFQITNSLAGEILSPNYPAQYPNNADCGWHIKMDDGFVVELTFLEFDLEEE